MYSNNIDFILCALCVPFVFCAPPFPHAEISKTWETYSPILQGQGKFITHIELSINDQKDAFPNVEMFTPELPPMAHELILNHVSK